MRVAGMQVCLLGWREASPSGVGSGTVGPGSGSCRPHPHSTSSYHPNNPQARLMVSAVWICSQVPTAGEADPQDYEDHGTQPLQVLSVPRLQRKLKEAAGRSCGCAWRKEAAPGAGKPAASRAGAPHRVGHSPPPCSGDGGAGCREGWPGGSGWRLGRGGPAQDWGARRKNRQDLV